MYWMHGAGMESSPIKLNVDCEAGSCGSGLRRSEPLDRAGAEVVAVTSMSRRALSYSIDNLLASPTSARRESDHRPASAALRLYTASQQRMLYASSSSSLS